jgi:hypothetical protein
MQGTTEVNLGPKLFAPGPAYVALRRVRSLNGLRLDELDCGKLTNENTANTDALITKKYKIKIIMVTKKKKK